MSLLLAIDTSAQAAGVALLHEGEVLAERIWRARTNHTVQLLPAARELLTSFAFSPEKLTAIAVAIGPGAFTGLRVGIATAKTLAWSLEIPVLGIGSLEGLALSSHGAARTLAVLDAGRGDWYWAMYVSTNGKRRCVSPPQIGNPAETLATLKQRTMLVGEMPASVAQLLASPLGRHVERGDSRLPAVCPGAIGILGQERLAAGERDDPATLTPVYLRRPAAEERREA